MMPLEEAVNRAESGSPSSRAAWSLVAWALRQTDATERGRPLPAPPATRPTLELIARLSDRPSADRDTTFLFRMAQAGATSARPMLESLARTLPAGDETATRAACFLSRERDREEMRNAMMTIAAGGKREELRGLAAAALWDASTGESGVDMRSRAREIADDLLLSPVIGNVAWGALIRVASKGAAAAPLIAEAPFRWIQWGCLE
jgi:hypothetical protein